MDKKTLLIFAKRILNSCSIDKSVISLRQLKTLLEEQGAPKDEIDLLVNMIQSVPEMKDAAKKAVLTEADVQIAARRARERKLREEAARYHGRC